MKKHPYFHFELKRQAKNWQGGVIIDFSRISPRTGGRKYIIFNKNLIFLGSGKNHPFPNIRVDKVVRLNIRSETCSYMITIV